MVGGAKIVEAGERPRANRLTALLCASALGAAVIGLALLGYYVVIQAFAERF